MPSEDVLTWEKFVAYMERFKADLSETYSNRQACRERHKAVDDDIASLKRIVFWAATAIVGAFLGLVVFLLQGHIVVG